MNYFLSGTFTTLICFYNSRKEISESLIQFSRTYAGAGGLPYSGYINKNNFNTLKTSGIYQCGGVTNNDVGINFWGIVLIVKANDYISQLLIGNVLAWRCLGDDGHTWGKFNIVTARTQ